MTEITPLTTDDIFKAKHAVKLLAEMAETFVVTRDTNAEERETDDSRMAAKELILSTITALESDRDALKARVAELNDARQNAIDDTAHSEIVKAIECGYQKLDELYYKDIASNITNIISFKLFSEQELLGQILDAELKRREAGE